MNQPNNNDGIDKDRAEELSRSIQKRYRKVSEQPVGQFGYPVGRDSAIELGYSPAWVDEIPNEVVDRFVGVGNPFNIIRPKEGTQVLDLGCGSGFDVFVAGILVGAEGQATGLDLTREMLEWPRKYLADWPLGNIDFKEGAIDSMPFEDNSFDNVISNGVLNLMPCKDTAFAEIYRVLKPSGIFAVADLLVTDTVPEEVLASMDAWST